MNREHPLKSQTSSPGVAIVDLGVGNLFSVAQACRMVGLTPSVTSVKSEIRAADAVILPGVGAFGNAMSAMQRLDLVETLKEAASTKPFMGVCLGMQLLMTESCEFGRHPGLDIVRGKVVKFDFEHEGSGERRPKVPQIGWNHIVRRRVGADGTDDWGGTPLAGIEDNVFMYFVHSYHVMPEEEGVDIARAQYGGVEFCAALRQRNVFACQFHPERSGPQGLRVYANMADLLRRKG